MLPFSCSLQWHAFFINTMTCFEKVEDWPLRLIPFTYHKSPNNSWIEYTHTLHRRGYRENAQNTGDKHKAVD